MVRVAEIQKLKREGVLYQDEYSSGGTPEDNAAFQIDHDWGIIREEMKLLYERKQDSKIKKVIDDLEAILEPLRQ